MNTSNGVHYGSSSIVDTPCWLLSISLELAILELVVHLMSMLITIFNFIIVFNSGLLHTNLKWVLLAQSVSSFMSELCRFTVMVVQVPSGDIFTRPPYANILGSLYVFSNTYRIFLAYVLLAERTLATVLFRDYEQYDKVWANISWLAITLSLSFVVLITQDSSAHDYNRFTLPSIIGLFVLQIAAIVLLLHNYRRNKTRYNKHFWTLKERFQLSENIRTLKQLRPTFVFYTLNVLFIYGIKFLFIFGLVVNDVPTKIAFMFQTLLLAIVNIGIEWTVITQHPMIKRKAVQWIKKLVNFRINRVTDLQNLPREMPKNLFGNQLIINRQKPDDYFKMLEKSWH
ncbi:hypothetical protein niasHT_010849 [Heterodera trifolii]|uniref:Gustatory receptor n=1 Tax=Heterodera trifolii TaxID=157864 RepID=A0ABD2LD17_9BILA